MLVRPFHGVIAAPYLPMYDNGEIDWPTLEIYMDWLATQSPAGIAMNMDASEVISLTEDEQEQVIKICKSVLNKRVPFLSGIVAGSTKSAAEKAEKYAKLGVDGFPIFPPFPTFSGAPVPKEMITRYHKAIADSANLPIICFQFPKGWGPDYTPEILKSISDIPQVIAIKEASFDVSQTLQTIGAASNLDRPIGVLTGSDTFIFEAILMGCSGALIGFAGTATKELVLMDKEARTGNLDIAKKIWTKLGPIARLCWGNPIRDFRPRMKEVLKWQGLFPCAMTREPQLGIGEGERDLIISICEKQGLERFL